jgi:hypothetical protein
MHGGAHVRRRDAGEPLVDVEDVLHADPTAPRRRTPSWNRVQDSGFRT